VFLAAAAFAVAAEVRGVDAAFDVSESLFGAGSMTTSAAGAAFSAAAFEVVVRFAAGIVADFPVVVDVEVVVRFAAGFVADFAAGFAVDFAAGFVAAFVVDFAAGFAGAFFPAPVVRFDADARFADG
jgi:hypothetical protein